LRALHAATVIWKYYSHLPFPETVGLLFASQRLFLTGLTQQKLNNKIEPASDPN
jgi:hypothetical protein